MNTYVEDTRDYGGDLDEAFDLMSAAVATNPDNPKLAAAIEGLKADIELRARLETDDLETAKALLQTVGDTLPFKRAVQFHHVLQPMKTFANELSFDFMRAVFLRCWEDEREDRSPETCLGRTLWPLFVNSPEQAKAFSLSFAETCDERKFFGKVMDSAVYNANGSEEGKAVAQDVVWLLKGKDPAEERAKAELKERRSKMASATSWAMSQNDFDRAATIMRSQSNRDLMDVRTAEDIISYANITSRIKAGDMEGAKMIAELCLELLLYMRQPDVAAEKGGVPSDGSVVLFVANSLILAVAEATEDTDFATNMAELAMDFMTSGSARAASLAFNLGCYHAKRGEKDEVLACAEQGIEWGKAPDDFLADADYAAFKDDPDFLKALGVA